MEKNAAFKAMASVGSVQALMKVVVEDIDHVWEDAPAGSPLEALAGIARPLADALATTLEGMREQAAAEFDNAEVPS